MRVLLWDCYIIGVMEFSLENIVIFGIALLVAISFHEAMHAFTAHWLGDDTASEGGRVTLNPAKHIDPLLTLVLPLVLVALSLQPILAAKPVPFNPERVRFGEFGAALVGLAGPFTNLVLAGVGALLVKVLPLTTDMLAAKLLVMFIAVNVALFVFNMLPIPPLDGSRLLYALAPEPVQRVMAQIESMGMLLLIPILILLIPVIGPILNMLNNSILQLLF